MSIRPFLAVATLGALLIGWVFATPAFRAPDETAHYLRALSIANGGLLGPREPYIAPTARQTAWVAHDARGVVVPARLSPPDTPCLDGRPDTSRQGCVEVSYTGDYAPLAYLLPALVIGGSRTAVHALWAARLASALPFLAFVAVAVALLWSQGVISILGLLAAMTPTTLFIGSVLNPNGLEIGAALAFAAAVLRISRAPRAVPWGVWVAAGTSGAVTLLAWQLGFAFVAIDLLLGMALLGRRGAVSLTAHHRRGVGATALALAAAAAAFVIYGVAAGALHGNFGASPLGPGLHQGLDQLHTTLYGAIGLFGLLTVALPHASYWVWWLLVVVIGTSGAVLSARRERVILVAVVLVALAFPVLFFAWVYRHSGFGLQPRYVMPVLQLIPLVGGELLFRSRAKLPDVVTRWLPAVVLAVVAGFQVFAWWVNAAVSAGKPMSLRFAIHPLWSPPLSWAPWIVLVIAGGVLLAGLGAWEVAGGRQRVAPSRR